MMSSSVALSPGALLSALLLLLASAAAAEGPALAVHDARIPAPPGDVAALYFVVENRGESDDRLLSASSPIARRVMIHETVHTEDGRARMGHVEGGVPVAAGQRVVLEPGGLHVMLMGVDPRPVEGGEVEVSLRFEKAGTLSVKARVVSYASLSGSSAGSSSGSQGGHHDHH